MLGTIGLDAAEGHRAAGLHGNFPEGDFAQAGHQLLDEISLADRDAAAGDDGVAAVGGLAKRRFERGRIVLHHAHVDDLATEPGEHAP